jgi:hypothetical protein
MERPLNTECVPQAQCDKRHSDTKWVLVFLGTFFLAMLGVSGAAMNAAANATAKSEANEARIDSLERHIKDRLDDIWSRIREY